MRAFVLAIFTLLIVSCTNTDKNQVKHVLPFIGQADVEYKTVNGKDVADTVYPKVPNFRYINQDSSWTQRSDFKGKILVVDFIFTHCPNICPIMTHNMKLVQMATIDLENQVEFVSFSIDPTNDTPSRFREYIKEMEINAPNWVFLTGDEKKTYDLAMNHLWVGVEKSKVKGENILHDNKVVLVDKEGYVRGMYAGTETNDMNRLQDDMRKLLKYEYGVKNAMAD